MFVYILKAILYSFIYLSSGKSTTVVLNSIGPNDNYFLTTSILLGSNNQNITVELDTGSTPLWVTSKDCLVKKKSCSGNHFDPTSSTSYVKTKDTFKITYEDGTFFKGNYGIDIINLGNITYSNLKFGLVNKAKYPIEDGEFNIGILGLSATDPLDEATSFINDIFLDSTITNKIFSIYLPKDYKLKGEMMIGSFNQNLIKSDPTWVDVELADEAWNLPKMFLSTENGLNLTSSSISIADTGSDILYGPNKDIIKLCNYLGLNIDSDQKCYTKCNNIPNIKNFTISFGNNLNLLVNIQNHFSYPYDNNGNCAIAVTGDLPANGWTIGLAIIRQWYTIWDFSNINNNKGKLGFAVPIDN